MPSVQMLGSVLGDLHDVHGLEACAMKTVAGAKAIMDMYS